MSKIEDSGHFFERLWEYIPELKDMRCTQVKLILDSTSLVVLLVERIVGFSEGRDLTQWETYHLREHGQPEKETTGNGKIAQWLISYFPAGATLTHFSAEITLQNNRDVEGKFTVLELPQEPDIKMQPDCSWHLEKVRE